MKRVNQSLSTELQVKSMCASDLISLHKRLDWKKMYFSLTWLLVSVLFFCISPLLVRCWMQNLHRLSVWPCLIKSTLVVLLSLESNQSNDVCDHFFIYFFYVLGCQMSIILTTISDHPELFQVWRQGERGQCGWIFTWRRPDKVSEEHTWWYDNSALSCSQELHYRKVIYYYNYYYF